MQGLRLLAHHSRFKLHKPCALFGRLAIMPEAIIANPSALHSFRQKCSESRLASDGEPGTNSQGVLDRSISVHLGHLLEAEHKPRVEEQVPRRVEVDANPP